MRMSGESVLRATQPGIRVSDRFDRKSESGQILREQSIQLLIIIDNEHSRTG
jgi:hypothetical protein